MAVNVNIGMYVNPTGDVQNCGYEHLHTELIVFEKRCTENKKQGKRFGFTLSNEYTEACNSLSYWS